MTHKALTLPMQNHPRIAALAFLCVPAGRAQQGWCKAPPVQIHKALAAGFKMAPHGIQQRLTEAVTQPIMPQIDDTYLGRSRIARPFRQLRMQIPFLERILQCFECGRCRAKHDGNIELSRSIDGKIAR